MDTLTPLLLVAEVRAEMARQGITAATVAAATDISRSSLSRKLRGDSEFTLSEALAVAGALGVPLSELMRRAQQGVAA